MAIWRLDGKPRRARRYVTSTNCPLKAPQDRLVFILVYLKTNPLQVAHAIMFGLPQGKTNQWIHVLLLVLRTAMRQLGDAPSRSLLDLARRLGMPVTEVAEAAAPFCPDGTERRIPRPKDADEQKSCYSGKKNTISSKLSY
jgi:hypothetical protein